MDHSHNIKDELNEFAPDLSRMKKEEGFEVPPLYFDRLGDEVIRQMKAESKVENEIKQPWLTVIIETVQNLFQPRFTIGMATIALLFIGLWQLMPDTATGSETLALESISDEEFDNYLAENLYEFEDDLLFSLVAEEPYFSEAIEDEMLDNYFEKINDDLDFEMLEELL